MRKRPLITLAISAILLAGAVSANAVQFPQVDISTKPAEPSDGWSIVDDKGVGYGDGVYSSINGANYVRSALCSTVSDAKCSDLFSFRVSVIVPPCPASSDATDVCIRGLKTADSSGVLQSATLEYEANTLKFPKDLKNKLPAGGGASVWKGASAKGGTIDYAIIVDLQINWHTSNDSRNPTTYKNVVGYSAQIVPVKLKTGNYYPTYINVGTQYPAGVTTQEDPSNCLIIDQGRCAYPDTFFPDQKIELTLQMDNAVTGWMFGRMKDTKVSTMPLSSDTTLLTVEGASINVPFGHAWVPRSAIEGSMGLQELDKYYQNLHAANPQGLVPSNHPGLFEFIPYSFQDGTLHTPNPKLRGSGAFQAIEPWLKTVSTTPTWRFQGMSPSSFWGMDQSTSNKVWSCTVKDNTKLHGLMTTNAMAYSWSPPALKDGFLTYKVAGAHFDADGSVYKGTYNLSMNAESAKCIYGFTDAPIQATVSISKEGGETTNIATELVSIQNGWMNLSANNFTFSDPTIRIKLTQEKAAAKPTPTASATPSPTASKVAASKITITCIKGKLKKVLTGTKPVCPIGYKKQ